MKQKILIVEDEAKIAQVLRDYLGQEGYQTRWLEDGSQALRHALSGDYALVILDVMLPEVDGISICRQIRSQSELPIVLVTARVEEVDRLLGLELGADDYICKPFSPREVVVRIRNILKRSKGPSREGSVIRYEGLIWNETAHECHVDNQLLNLTPVEFGLLGTLLSAPGRVFDRGTLMHRSYADGRIVSDRTIDSHMRNLRSKLGKFGTSRIHAIYGVGYKLEKEA